MLIVAHIIHERFQERLCWDRATRSGKSPYPCERTRPMIGRTRWIIGVDPENISLRTIHSLISLATLTIHVNDVFIKISTINYTDFMKSSRIYNTYIYICICDAIWEKGGKSQLEHSWPRVFIDVFRFISLYDSTDLVLPPCEVWSSKSIPSASSENSHYFHNKQTKVTVSDLDETWHIGTLVVYEVTLIYSLYGFRVRANWNISNSVHWLILNAQ